MSRKKLRRFEEMKTFTNAYDYPVELKGKWSGFVFKNTHPLVLELGCGRGEYTVGLSALYPGKNFIGVDLKGSRIWRGAKTCFEEHRLNAAFIRSRIELIEYYFNKNEVDEIWITFPDPQPKDKWEKKRLTSENYLTIYKKILKRGGLIHLKTDNTLLYEYTLELIHKLQFPIQFHHHDVYSLPDIDASLTIETTYEKKFREKGETIKYIRFQVP